MFVIFWSCRVVFKNPSHLRCAALVHELNVGFAVHAGSPWGSWSVTQRAGARTAWRYLFKELNAQQHP